MSRTAFVTRSDEADTNHKRALVRYTAANNPDVAALMASAIASDETLLKDLAAVVKLMSRHDRARSILEEVFKRPGIAKKYASAHKAFARVQLEQLFAPA